MAASDHFDVCIVGAGVLGLAVAYKLSRQHTFKKRSIVILERHAGFGEETSSRNSEVIHAGLYYPAGSLKATCCVEGKNQLYAFCNQFNVPCRQIGKVIIAATDQQTHLEAVARQAAANGVADLQPISKQALQRLEPALTADSALLSASSGIIDSHAYMQTLLTLAENEGVIFSPHTLVTSIGKEPACFSVSTSCHGEPYVFSCDQLVNAAGLSAQSVARQIADFPEKLIPEALLVKGTYFTLQGKSPFRHLVYPIPEPGLKGLGVHVTLDMAGQVRFGPDAENCESIDYTVDARKETAFRQAIATYYPDIAGRKLQPGYCGIRPKLAASRGAVRDFQVAEYSAIGFPGLVQLFGIESPGLTASLALADRVVGYLAR